MTVIARAWNAWSNFWFAKADPTPLGFIRILTGLVLVYTHLVYCFDLYGFFGPRAWFDLESINRERREYPHIVQDWNTWDDFVMTVRIPSQPHRKGPVLAWMQAVPGDPNVKANVLSFLREIEQLNDTDAPRSLFGYLSLLRSDARARKNQLDALVNEAIRTPIDQIPNAVKNLPEKGPRSRESLRGLIERFSDTLPKADDDRQYILNYFLELDGLGRSELVSFLDKLPADAAERKAAIDYVSYWGFDRSKTIRQGQPIFSMWFHLTGPTEMAVAHAIAIAIMVLFTLGLWTRVTAVLTWFAAVNYIHRTQYVLFGMDTMSNILLIYLMIGNSGGALSLDRLIARARAVRESLRRTGQIDGATAEFLARPTPTMSAGLALRLTQVHFCFIYMAAGLSKLKGPAWWGHQAYWDTCANPEFTMIFFTWYEEAMRMLVSNRFLYSLVAAGAIIHTFVAEIGLPFLVWTRARPWIVFVGILLHAGIAIFMGLTVFSLLMMLLLLSYIPGAAIRKCLFPASPSAIRRFVFDPKSDRQREAAAWASAFDTEGAIELHPEAGTSSIRVNVDGKTNIDPATAVMDSSNVLSPMAWIPGFKAVMRRCWAGS